MKTQALTKLVKYAAFVCMQIVFFQGLTNFQQGSVSKSNVGIIIIQDVCKDNLLIWNIFVPFVEEPWLLIEKKRKIIEKLWYVYLRYHLILDILAANE